MGHSITSPRSLLKGKQRYISSYCIAFTPKVFLTCLFSEYSTIYCLTLDSCKEEKIQLFWTFVHCSFKSTSYSDLESKEICRHFGYTNLVSNV